SGTRIVQAGLKPQGIAQRPLHARVKAAKIQRGKRSNRREPRNFVGLQPTKLALDADGKLAIDWNDGLRTTYSVSALRAACPCATCREKRSQPAPAAAMLPILSAAETQPLKLLGMKPVGNYAYAIEFSDG